MGTRDRGLGSRRKTNSESRCTPGNTEPPIHELACTRSDGENHAMPDMLVKLYNLPMDLSCIAALRERGVEIRKPIGPEKHLIEDWILQTFSDAWASEFDMTMRSFPVTSWIATRDQQVVGFACFDATGLGFFGPTGVHPDHRGQ